MTNTTNTVWDSLNNWSSGLFLFGSLPLLVTAIYRGSAYLFEEITFDLMIGNMVLFGRLAVLLGLAGLSVELVNQSPRLGRSSRFVVSMAILATTILIALAVFAGLKTTNPLLAIAGLSTVALTIASYLLFGAVILRSGALSPVIGSLLLAAGVALIVVVAGMMFLPVNLIGAVIEGVLFVFYLLIGIRLRSSGPHGGQSEHARDAAY